MSEGSPASPGGANTGGEGVSQTAPQTTESRTTTAPAGDAGGETATITSPEGDAAAITAPKTDENAVDKTTIKAEKKKLKDHLKQYLVDQDFGDDDDAFEEAGIKYIDGLHQYRDKNREYNQKIIDVFEAEPAIVDIMRDLTQGATMMEALARHVDLDNLKPLEGDPDYDTWKKALTDRDVKMQDKDKRAKEYDDNVAFTSKELKAFMEETKVDDAKFKEYADKVDTLLQDAYKGKIGKDFFALLYKGLNFDKAVETAKAQGEVKARNEKIKAEIAKEDTAGDGLPKLREGGEMDVTEKRPMTAAERIASDIDDFNAKRKPLEAYLSQK